MRILHIINSMKMGGGQSLLVELAPLQEERGNDVTILELTQAIDKTLIQKVKEMGVNVISLKGENSVYSPINVFKIIPYLKQYDIVHVHLFPAQYWVALAKLISGCKTPIITTEHSTKNKRRGKWVFKIIDTYIYNRYEEVIACADKALETFKMYYPNVSAISIPNGVNISKYRDASAYSKHELAGIDEESFVATMVARFIPSKRQDTLVKAISLLPSKFHAILVGGQPNDEGLLRVKKQAGQLKVLDRVHFLFLRGDVPQILKSSNVIVMSSEYEGLSLSSIEGMAGGKPFIASDVNGLREVVKGAGILVKCGDAKQLATEIKRLSEDKSYYSDVVAKCMERASHYDIHDVADKYLEEYKRFVLE